VCVWVCGCAAMGCLRFGSTKPDRQWSPRRVGKHAHAFSLLFLFFDASQLFSLISLLRQLSALQTHLFVELNHTTCNRVWRCAPSSKNVFLHVSTPSSPEVGRVHLLQRMVGKLFIALCLVSNFFPHSGSDFSISRNLLHTCERIIA
jgi:hypothetical protein